MLDRLHSRIVVETIREHEVVDEVVEYKGLVLKTFGIKYAIRKKKLTVGPR